VRKPNDAALAVPGRAAAGLTDARQGMSEEIRRLLCQGLANDEHVIPLAPTFQEARAKAVRLLAAPNIDGYAVLTRDEASDTVALHRDLLWKQFDLYEGGRG
jgi:uncharacterized membrane protein